MNRLEDGKFAERLDEVVETFSKRYPICEKVKGKGMSMLRGFAEGSSEQRIQGLGVVGTPTIGGLLAGLLSSSS